MIKILKYTTLEPLSLIGEMAGICWGAKTEDIEKNIKRAWDCIDSGHDRTEEFPDIYMVIDGYSAKCLRELYTHIGGAPTRLQASTRYIDYEKKGVPVITPISILRNAEALRTWNGAIEEIKSAMSKLKDLGIPNEDVTNLLPLAYESKMVWKVNLRTLIHFMHKRRCARAYYEIRNLSADICDALSRYSEEWEEIVKTLFVPECEFLGYCREKNSCGRKPKKDEII